MSEPLVFNDLTPVEVPVQVGQKNYVLREASGGGAATYRNALMASTRFGPNGKPAKVEGMADAEALLVSLCLFEDFGEKNGVRQERKVPLEVVRSWPARVVKALFDKAKAISDLDEKDTPETLEEKMADLREKLAAMKNGTADPSDPKASPEATTFTSA